MQMTLHNLLLLTFPLALRRPPPQQLHWQWPFLNQTCLQYWRTQHGCQLLPFVVVRHARQEVRRQKILHTLLLITLLLALPLQELYLQLLLLNQPQHAVQRVLPQPSRHGDCLSLSSLRRRLQDTYAHKCCLPPFSLQHPARPHLPTPSPQKHPTAQIYALLLLPRQHRLLLLRSRLPSLLRHGTALQGSCSFAHPHRLQLGSL
mmetsp:Transcript_15270/g.27186  ORF Transcript_15270/g.27186 Transcript_15270/m.27186 type:complete len:204 (-) Transcript_15270:14-625(-)